MKAITYKSYGPPESLRIEDVPKPTPSDNEVLIKIHAVEATKSDCEMRSFCFPVIWFWLPLRIAFGIRKPRNKILGSYFAGEIESVGKNVSKFSPGDSVFGASKLKLGAYAEYSCLPANYTLAPKPANISYEEAAAVPLGGLNALHFLRKAEIKSDEKILIIGAGGSIGSFAVQIAKDMGAHVTVVDSAIKEEMLRKIGADHFIDYAKTNYFEDGQKYDVIFDIVAHSPYSKTIGTLAPQGRYLMANPRFFNMLRSRFTEMRTGKKVIFAFAPELESELLSLKELIEEKRLNAVVDKIYPMEKAADAHRRVETEQRLGSVVISMRQ